MDFRTKVKTITGNIYIQHEIGDNNDRDYSIFYNMYMIIFNVTSGAEIHMEGAKYNIQPNELYIIAPNQKHRVIIHDKEKYEWYTIYINQFYINSINNSQSDLLEYLINRDGLYANSIVMNNENSNLFIEMIKNLLQITNEKNIYAVDIKIKVQVINILLFISELFNNASQENENIPIANEFGFHSNSIKQVIEYVNTNYYKELNAEGVAKLFKLNRHVLNTLLVKFTCLRFHPYLVYVRISKARELLDKGEMSVHDVCFETGFNDYSHFIRTFKTIVGKTPGTYARQYK